MQDSMLKSFTRAPRIVERILRVFPTDRLDEQIERDRFTAREVIAHLANYEQTVLERFTAAVKSPGKQVPAYDPDESAAAHHYNQKDVFHEAEVFESRREMTNDFLCSLTDEDWNKTFTTSAGRTFTNREYLEMIMAHDLEHIDQLTSYLATEVATIS